MAGHLGTVDNFMIRLLAPEKAVANPAYQAKFGMGSRPTSNPPDYPPPAEVLDFMRARRGVLLEILAGLNDDALSAPPPKGTPDIMPDLGSIFEMAVWHEALHAGQVTVARRSLGLPPLVDAPPRPEPMAPNPMLRPAPNSAAAFSRLGTCTSRKSSKIAITRANMEADSATA